MMFHCKDGILIIKDGFVLSADTKQFHEHVAIVQADFPDMPESAANEVVCKVYVDEAKARLGVRNGH